MAKLVIKNTQGNASQLEFDRNGNANWLVTSDRGYLRFQSDWNNTKGNYEDILVLSEATTGSATLKGSFTTGGDIVSAKGIFSKTVNGESDVGVRYGDGKYLYLWGSDTSGRRGLWDTDFGGIIGISDNGRYFMGQSTSATRIDYPAQLTSDSAIDNFNIANGFQVGTWNNTSTPGVANGIIINAGWTSTSYGAQIAIDDDPTYYIALRQRGTGGWSGWKRIPMADGTGASGTWGISITGNASYANSAGHATYLNTTAGNEIRIHNATGLTNGGSLWLGWAWADGNKTVTKEWYIGNFSGGGLANVYAANFIGSWQGNSPSAFAPASHSHSYVPLSGGTMTGKLQVNAPIFGYNYSNNNNAAAFIFDKPSSHYTGIGAGGYSDIIHFGPCNADGTWVSNYNQIWRFQGCVYAVGWLETDNYGSSEPGTSTPGYGRDGAIYFKV